MIIIDTLSLLTPLTGIGKYTYEISKEIKKHFDTTFYYGYFSKKLITKPPKISKIKKFSILKKIARKLLSLKTKNTNKSFDLYFQPNFILDSNIKAHKKIVTIHDFSFEKKEWHPKERYEYFKNKFYTSIKEADHIITVSNTIKQEIIQKLHFHDSQITVIYNGIDHNIFRPKQEKPDNIDFKYILFVGSIEPRKNLKNLLKAYDLLSNDLKKEYKLLLVGFKGWENKEIMSLINKNKKNIQYLGYVDDIMLSKLYSFASLFVYPSLYEGFGIPPIEAMACGSVVLTSNVSVMPEICKDAAIYCNPYDEKDIARQITDILTNNTLQQQKKKESLKHAKFFTWEKSAKEHIKLFKRILNDI